MVHTYVPGFRPARGVAETRGDAKIRHLATETSLLTPWGSPEIYDASVPDRVDVVVGVLWYEGPRVTGHICRGKG